MRPTDDDYEDYDDPDFDPPEDESSDFDERQRGAHPPHRRSGGRRWLLILGIGFGTLMLSCCGGLFLLSAMFKTFKLSNGEHLGGSAMNVKFDYEVKTRDFVLDGAYFIVVENAEGVRRERSVPTRFDRRGTFYFNALDAGPAEQSKSPIKVWIEKEDQEGDRSKGSNVISIPIKTN